MVKMKRKREGERKKKSGGSGAWMPRFTEGTPPFAPQARSVRAGASVRPRRRQLTAKKIKKIERWLQRRGSGGQRVVEWGG